MEYGLIGEHLGHSYSREIHERIADYRYALLELKPEEVLPFLRAREFKALNVTIPYKETVMPALDFISERAKTVGAVNTVLNRDGKLYGYNTDFRGMCLLIEHAGIKVRGKKVLILGTGGTSKTGRAVMRFLGAGETVTVSRKSGEGVVSYEEARVLHADADILLNTTPVGMYPLDTAQPVDLTDYPLLSGIVDVVYHPLRTNLVLSGLEKGIPSVGGLYMLSAQAVVASALFLSAVPPKEEGGGTDLKLVERAFSFVEAEKRNLVLTGMPSSGKTSVGKAYAARCGKRFVDTDEIICSRIESSVSELIKKNGENAFRDLESAVIRELSAESGLVIATGGGAVLREENVRALKRNGLLVFLDRPLDKLVPTDDRPLSDNPEKLAALFEKRRPIYLHAADIRLNADGTVEEVCALLSERFKEE